MYPTQPNNQWAGLPSGAVNIAGSLPSPSVPRPYPLYNQTTKPSVPTGSFSGWNAQNAAVQNRVLSPNTGMQTYLNSERGISPQALQMGIGSTPSPTGSFSPQAAEFYVMQRIANGQAVSQAEAEAAMNLLTKQGLMPAGQTTQAAGTGQTIQSTDFTNTGFYQQYQAQGTSFENQLRWDPERKQYIKIGRLINEGRLDPKDRRAKLKRSRRGRQESYEQQYFAPEPEAQAQAQPAAGFTGSFGVVNFNTGTG